MITIRTSYHCTPQRLCYEGMPWDSIVTGGASLIAAGISSKASKYAAKKQLQAVRETNLANQQLAREQNSWNRQMWEDTNAYNSTVNQLQRWRDAGLNPNSFAGQASPVAADTMQSADLANQVAPDVGSYIQQSGNAWAQGVQNAMSQILAFKRLNIENKKADAEIENLSANSTFVKEQVKQILPAQAKNLTASAALSEKQIENIEKGYAKITAEIENLYANANLSDTKSNEAKINMKWLRETWDDRKASIGLQNSMYRANIGLTHQQCKNLAEQFEGILFDNALKGNEVVMTEVTNWIKKVEAMSNFADMQKDQEKANFFGTLFGALGVAIQSTGGNKGAAMSLLRERNDWRANMYKSAESWANPTTY